jgi:hypothetical protein
MAARKLNKQTVLRQLHAEFRKLERGKDITLTIRARYRARISWQEGVHATFCAYEDTELSYWNAADKAQKKYTDRYNAAIALYVAKCDQYADRFGQDRDKFWTEVFNFDSKKGSKP